MPDFGSGPLSSLQFRLALGFVLALALALSLIGLAAGVVAGHETRKFDRDRDLARIARVRQFVSEYYAGKQGWNLDEPALQEALERTGLVSGSRIIVYNSYGAVVADSHDSFNRGTVGRDRKSRGGPWKDLKKFPVHDGEEQVGAFTVSAVSPEGDSLLDSLDPAVARIPELVNRSLLWAGVCAAILGTLLVWLLSRRTLAPLQNLGAAARRLGRGDLSQRAETAGPTEIRELAQSFNAMAEGLEEAERQRRHLTADVAHELRTPLSNIQGYLEAIRDGLVQPTPEAIDTIHSQALHLSRLVEDLRLLAQVEAGELRLRLSSVHIGALLQASLEAVRPRAEAKGVTIIFEDEPALPPAELDSTRIAQVIGNLLENAITHTPEGGSVSVSALSTASSVEVTVSDTGPGINPEDLPRLFDRFYRADPSRSRDTGGSGLGLTIARRLVEAHGGTIEAKSAAGDGSRFIVSLPFGQQAAKRRPD